MRTAKTDQTGQMPRLIQVFTGCTGNFVGFVILLLIFILLQQIFTFFPFKEYKN